MARKRRIAGDKEAFEVSIERFKKYAILTIIVSPKPEKQHIFVSVNSRYSIDVTWKNEIPTNIKKMEVKIEYPKKLTNGKYPTHVTLNYEDDAMTANIFVKRAYYFPFEKKKEEALKKEQKLLDKEAKKWLEDSIK